MQYVSIPLAILAMGFLYGVLAHGWPKFITINHNHYHGDKSENSTEKAKKIS